MMSAALTAQTVALEAVVRSPGVGHLAAHGPKLGKERMALAAFKDLDRTALQRFGVDADGPPDQLHVVETEVLEQLIESDELFGNHVGVTVIVSEVVNRLNGQTLLIEIMLLVGFPEARRHCQHRAEARRFLT